MWQTKWLFRELKIHYNAIQRMRSGLLKSHYYNTPARKSFGPRRPIISEHKVLHDFFSQQFCVPWSWGSLSRHMWELVCYNCVNVLYLIACVGSYCNNSNVVHGMDNVVLKTRCMECIKWPPNGHWFLRTCITAACQKNSWLAGSVPGSFILSLILSLSQLFRLCWFS